jgi:hypothetical protein
VKRTPIKRGTKPLKRTPIKAKPKQHEPDPEYAAALVVVEERDHGECRSGKLLRSLAPEEIPASFPRRCGGRRDPHHIEPTRPDGTGGPKSDPANIATECRDHHSWIHANRFEAIRLGLLKKRRRAA